MADDQGVGARPQADQALAVPATPLRVDGPSGFDPSRIMRGALETIRDMEPRLFDGFPLDWREQIDACEECQAYASHPIQQGICNTHRQPIYARDRHERHEREAMHWRMSSVAREALSAIAIEARSDATGTGAAEGESAGPKDIAQGPSQ